MAVSAATPATAANYPFPPKYTPNRCIQLISFPFKPTAAVSKRPFTISSAQKSSTSGMANEQKRELLEQYGLNPHEFLTDPSLKTRRRRNGEEKTGGGFVPSDKIRQSRQTHKLLQVLGGKARRKKLLSPKGMDVRPMMEVVKGAAFAILQAAGGCPASLRPGRWLDLYSGTGSVGIEAISRGCTEVHFVEMDPWVVSDILRPNLEWTGFLDVSVIHTVRVESFLERAEQFVGKDGPFDYVSITPPYTQVDYGVLMNQVSNSPLIGEDTLIVVEYPSRTDMLDACGCLIKIADRRFGRTHLAIYGPTWALKKKKSELSSRTVVGRV